MPDKVKSVAEVVRSIPDGSHIALGGFAIARTPAPDETGRRCSSRRRRPPSRGREGNYTSRGQFFRGFSAGSVDDGWAVLGNFEEIDGEFVAAWFREFDYLDGEIVTAEAVDEERGILEL